MIDRSVIKRSENGGYIDVDDASDSEPEEIAVDSGFMYVSHEDEEEFAWFNFKFHAKSYFHALGHLRMLP